MKHGIFLKFKLNLHTSLKLYFQLQDLLDIILPRQLCRLSFHRIRVCFCFRQPILDISIVSFSSNLNRLNPLSACHKLEPIGNAQNLSLGFI